MNIDFKAFVDEIDTLIGFLTSETWEYYGTPNLKPEKIRAAYKNNAYTGDDCKTFWVVINQDTKVGMIRIYDLQNGDPLFDVRILKRYKGLGIGTETVKWLVDHIFKNYPDKNRIEANTRQDNYAMRCVLHKSGFLKEAHHRKAWQGQDQIAYDAVGYGMTKEDWEKGQVTPLNWMDFKC